MKIEYGSIITDGSGKLGGFVAARNRGGAYLRTKTSPTQPDTIYQEYVRTQLAWISSQWSGLSDAQRATWNNAVESYKTTNIFGDKRNPSGINLFIKLNINRWRIGFNIAKEVPDKRQVKYEEISNVEFPSFAPEEAVVNFPTEHLKHSHILLRATPPVSAGVTYITNRLRDVLYVELKGDTFSYGEEYVARFGNISPGDIIWITVTIIGRNGLQGVTQKRRVIAT
jgi:hypothetical protein